MEEEREFGLGKREGEGANSVTVSSGFPLAAKSGADYTNPTLWSTLLFLGKDLGDSSPLQAVVVRMACSLHREDCAKEEGFQSSRQAQTGDRKEGERKA